MASKQAVAYLERDGLPLTQLNNMRKCLRCWHCCLTTSESINWKMFNRDFELPLKWMQLQQSNPTIHICPMLTVTNDMPTCLIYLERPEMCRATFCKWMNKL